MAVSYGAYDVVNGMEIDELGDFRFKGKKETDHYTIFVDITLGGVHLDTQKKKVKWNINAPPEKWMLFREILSHKKEAAETIMADETVDMTARYKKVEKIIYSIHRKNDD